MFYIPSLSSSLPQWRALWAAAGMSQIVAAPGGFSIRTVSALALLGKTRFMDIQYIAERRGERLVYCLQRLPFRSHENEQRNPVQPESLHPLPAVARIMGSRGHVTVSWPPPVFERPPAFNKFALDEDFDARTEAERRRLMVRKRVYWFSVCFCLVFVRKLAGVPGLVAREVERGVCVSHAWVVPLYSRPRLGCLLRPQGGRGADFVFSGQQRPEPIATGAHARVCCDFYYSQPIISFPSFA